MSAIAQFGVFRENPLEGLPRARRRRIARDVVRGRRVADPADAHLAVAYARWLQRVHRPARRWHIAAAVVAAAVVGLAAGAGHRFDWGAIGPLLALAIQVPALRRRAQKAAIAEQVNGGAAAVVETRPGVRRDAVDRRLKLALLLFVAHAVLAALAVVPTLLAFIGIGVAVAQYALALHARGGWLRVAVLLVAALIGVTWVVAATLLLLR